MSVIVINFGRTDLNKITTTTCHLFDDYLLISLTNNWIGVFGRIPEFDVMIDSDDKLRLTSTDCIKKRECS